MRELLVVFWHFRMGSNHELFVFRELLDRQFTLLEISQYFNLSSEHTQLLLDYETVYPNVLACYAKDNIQLITCFDEMYPNSLYHMYTPPLVLAYRGNIQLLRRKKISFVSEDDLSYYAGQVLDSMVLPLQKTTVTLSILFNVSRYLYDFTQRHTIQAILVLASSFDRQYPLKHLFLEQHMMKNGLVITEYPQGVSFSKLNLLRHRQLLIGLSSLVCVLDCPQNSSHLLNAYIALEQNKDVIVPPHNLFQDNGYGANQLIQQGSRIYLSQNDLIEAIQESYE